MKVRNPRGNLRKRGSQGVPAEYARDSGVRTEKVQNEWALHFDILPSRHEPSKDWMVDLKFPAPDDLPEVPNAASFESSAESKLREREGKISNP